MDLYLDCEEVGDKRINFYKNITIRNSENLRTSFAKEKENYMYKYMYIR